MTRQILGTAVLAASMLALQGCASSGGGATDSPIVIKQIYGTEILIPVPDDAVDACEVDYRVWQRAQSLTPPTHHVLTCFANTFDTEKLALGDIVYIASTYRELVGNTYTADSFAQISDDIEKQISLEKSKAATAGTGEINTVRIIARSPTRISWVREQSAENSHGQPTTVGIYTATVNINQKLVEATVSADLEKTGGVDDLIEMGDDWLELLVDSNRLQP